MTLAGTTLMPRGAPAHEDYSIVAPSLPVIAGNMLLVALALLCVCLIVEFLRSRHSGDIPPTLDRIRPNLPSVWYCCTTLHPFVVAACSVVGYLVCPYLDIGIRRLAAALVLGAEMACCCVLFLLLRRLTGKSMPVAPIAWGVAGGLILLVALACSFSRMGLY